MFKIVKSVKDPVDKKFVAFCQGYLQAGGKVLEIGPGDGEFSQRLMKVLPTLEYGFVDIYNGLKYQRQREVQIADVARERINKPDQSLDAVIASQVIEHLHNLAHFVQEAHRVLRPRGVLLVKMPNFDNFFQKVRFLLTGYPLRLDGNMDNGGHVNFVPHKYLPHFLGPYFALREKKGDIFMDPLFTHRLLRLVKKDGYVISERISSLYFSWNVMLCLEKKEKR